MLPIVFNTYILKSLKDNRYYFGHTKDLAARLGRHNAGKVASTKHRRPWVIHYTEVFPDKSTAYQREIFFKSFAGRKWLIAQKIIDALK